MAPTARARPLSSPMRRARPSPPAPHPAPAPVEQAGEARSSLQHAAPTARKTPPPPPSKKKTPPPPLGGGGGGGGGGSSDVSFRGFKKSRIAARASSLGPPHPDPLPRWGR